MSKAKAFKDAISPEIPWKKGSYLWSYGLWVWYNWKISQRRDQKHL